MFQEPANSRSKRNRRVSIAILMYSVSLALGLTVSPINPVSAKAEEKPLSIKFIGDGEMFGPVEVTSTPQGLRVKSKIGYMVWRADKPDHVCMVNPENKTFLPVSFAYWIADTREEFADIPKVERTECKDVVVDGMKVHLWSGFQKDESGKEFKVVEYYTLPGYSLATAGEKLWCDALGLKNIKEFPLAASQASRHHRHKKRLNSDMADFGSGSGSHSGARHGRWKQAVTLRKITMTKVDPKLFIVPADFKKAKDQGSLYLSSDGELKADDIEEFFMRKMK